MNSTCCLKAFRSPTRSALSQLNLGLLYTVSILLFICVLFWLHMGSVHQDASGLKHIPLLTPCYIFMWANMSNRNSHVGRHVLFSNHHPCYSSNISLLGYFPCILYITYMCCFTIHMTALFIYKYSIQCVRCTLLLAYLYFVTWNVLFLPKHYFMVRNHNYWKVGICGIKNKHV